MTDKVVDASALAAFLFREPAAQQMKDRLSGSRLHAPELLQYEIANICIQKIKRGELNAMEAHDAIGLLRDFQIDFYNIDTSAVFETAIAHKLTAYDASYLWLARDIGCELVTLDQRLQAAATQAREA